MRNYYGTTLVLLQYYITTVVYGGEKEGGGELKGVRYAPCSVAYLFDSWKSYRNTDISST